MVPEVPLVLLLVGQKVKRGPFSVLLEPNVVLKSCSFGVDLLNNEDECKSGIGGGGFTVSAADVIVDAKPASILGTIEQSADPKIVSASLFAVTAGCCWEEEATGFSTFSAACGVKVILLLQLLLLSPTESFRIKIRPSA